MRQAALGAWLRGQRRERGWNVPEMARRLRRAATETGDTLPRNECLWTMVRRWERGDTGVSERYRLHYCRAFGISPDQFGGAARQPAMPHTAQKPPLAVIIRGIADGLTGDAAMWEQRAQPAGDTAFAALCRGQALACRAAAELLTAALADG